MSKTCEYFFAPQSPYAYLGHARFVAMAEQHGVQIVLRPCDLGKVFSVSGGLPLLQRAPQRQAYRLLEMQRWADHLQLPINLQPKYFPVSGDAAARLLIAAKLAHGTDTAVTLAGAIMQAVWVDEKNIADNDTLVALANMHKLDGKVLLKASGTTAVQSEYDAHTDAAIAANVFGAPWFVVDGEGYWGQDRLDFVERALAK